MDLLHHCGATASRSAEVLSFQRLARRVLSETGGGADFTLDEGGKLLTMRRSLEQAGSELKVFGKSSRRAAFLQQLTDLADEFYAYDISPDVYFITSEELLRLYPDMTAKEREYAAAKKHDHAPHKCIDPVVGVIQLR